jgi:hypothetical protein
MWAIHGSQPYETIRKEEISSLLKTACKQMAAIAKAVSEFVITGIYSYIPMCSLEMILFV